MCPIDDPICHDVLEVLIPISPFNGGNVRLWDCGNGGRGIKEVARHFKVPVSTVEKMLRESAATTGLTMYSAVLTQA